MSAGPIKYQWVVGSFEGPQAKSVLDQAAAGIGYFILESGGSRFATHCIAAFRRPMDSPVPEHLTLVTDQAKIEMYDRKYAARNGISERDAP